MSQCLIAKALEKYNDAKLIRIYNGEILAQKEKVVIQKMADCLGVSFPALFIRLREINLFDHRPIDEYVRENLHLRYLMLELNYNRKFNPPSPEVLRLLELSRREVEGMAKRTLKCPVCGFRIDGVYADGIGHRDIKCQKCKLEATVNLAYFRRQRQNQRYIRWAKELQNLNLRK